MKDYEEDFDPRTELEKLIYEAKHLRRSLDCLIQLENPRAFTSKGSLIMQCQFLSDSLIRFNENYRNDSLQQ